MDPSSLTAKQVPAANQATEMDLSTTCLIHLALVTLYS